MAFQNATRTCLCVAAAPLAFVALLLQPLCAFAAEPVKHIRIYVQPYYEAGRTADEHPQVAVGESLSGMLGSNRREDILAARDVVVAAPKLVTPMTLKARTAS